MHVQYFLLSDEGNGFELKWRENNGLRRLRMSGFKSQEESKIQAKRISKKLGMRLDKVD